MNIQKYIPAADLIRTVAILGAVGIHIIQPIYSRFDFVGGTTWWVTDLWNAFSRISIPLFIMLSGYLLLDKKETLEANRTRTIKRIIIPLLVWFTFYTFWNGGYPTLQELQVLPMFLSLIKSSVFHLYFLVILAGLYIFMPVLKKYFLHWIYVPFFLIGGIVFILGQYLFPGALFTNMLTIWIPYTGYFLAGRMLGKLQVSRRAYITLLLTLTSSMVVTSVLSLVSAQYLHVGNSFLYPPGVLSPYFDHYVSPNVIVMSLCAFILLLNTTVRSKNGQQVMKNIARNSFGIYLIHSFLIDFIDKPLHLANDFVHIPLLLYLGSKFAVVFLISYILTSCGRRLLYVRVAFGEKHRNSA